MLRSNPGYARTETFKRDNGVCAICKVDTQALFGFDTPEYRAAKEAAEYYRKKEDELMNLWYNTQDKGVWDQLQAHLADWRSANKALAAFIELKRKLVAEKSKELIADGWPARRVHNESLWDMDHIKPVIEGGGECGMDNLRTLCIKCHKAETAKLRKRMKDVSKKS
jgi:hypothetical protein